MKNDVNPLTIKNDSKNAHDLDQSLIFEHSIRVLQAFINVVHLQ